ncbi:MAG TPA: BON domain-containing protein [Pirellulales bacterium]
MRRFFTAWAITIAVSWSTCVSADVQDNDQVAHKIYDVLKASGQMSGSSFVIKCQDGTASLEGRVATEEQKALALQLTGEVPEVNDVVDRLRVEPKGKAANPLKRMFTLTSGESPIDVDAEETSAAPAESPIAPLKRNLTNWFKHPAVRAAKAPQPRAEELTPTELADEEMPPVTRDESIVHPESLEERSEPGEPANLLVRQVANLRSIFSRSQPSRKQAQQVAMRQPQQVAVRQPMPTRGNCAACEGRVDASAMPHVTQVANKRHRTTGSPRVSQSSQLAQSAHSTAAGRVRMVPMVELADGRLVPVDQGRRTPAATQANSKQRAVNVSRSSAMPNSRSRQALARRQEVLEGPLDGEPAPMMDAPMNGAMGGAMRGGPLPSYVPGTAAGVAPAYYDQPNMPNYSWPSYAAHPNYAGVTYPRQYSPTAWPYIGPFYPYPQVPLGWRKVTLEWDDGWWFLDFDDTNRSYGH